MYATILSETSHADTRILLVDDDDLVRDTLAGTLAEFGYRCDAVATAEEALAMLRGRAYSLVLSDIVMPGLSGLELAGIIARCHPDVPVVVLTGYGHVEAARSALRNDAADIVTKPICSREIPAVIERSLQRRRREIERIALRGEEVLLGAIEALAAAIDAKQTHTAEHSRRVAALSLWIGERLALGPAEKRVLELSAYLHDIGNIEIPVSLLNKPGPLSGEERERIQQHPVTGGEMLARIPDLSYVAGIVRHHHERVDGSGYPDGLSGPAIPLLSQILAVADAFETMTADRPYCRARSIAQAAGELRAHSGTQFDASVVALLLARIEAREPLPISLTAR